MEKPNVGAVYFAPCLPNDETVLKRDLYIQRGKAMREALVMNATRDSSKPSNVENVYEVGKFVIVRVRDA